MGHLDLISSNCLGEVRPKYLSFGKNSIFPNSKISGLSFDFCQTSETNRGSNGEGKLDTPCVFPFKFRGKVYNACTFDHTSQDNDIKPWCSTKTDSDGNHVQGNWGVCDDVNT